MDAAVVELNALADAVRPCSQNDDFGLLGGQHLIGVFTGGIVIRGESFELRPAGVHCLVDRLYAAVSASTGYFIGRDTPKPAELRIGKAELSGASPVGCCKLRHSRLALHARFA